MFRLFVHVEALEPRALLGMADVETGDQRRMPDGRDLLGQGHQIERVGGFRAGDDPPVRAHVFIGDLHAQRLCPVGEFDKCFPLPRQQPA